MTDVEWAVLVNYLCQETAHRKLTIARRVMAGQATPEEFRAEVARHNALIGHYETHRDRYRVGCCRTCRHYQAVEKEMAQGAKMSCELCGGDCDFDGQCVKPPIGNS